MLAEYRASRPPGKMILRTPIASPPRMKYFNQLGFRRIETIVYLGNIPAGIQDDVLRDTILNHCTLRDAPWPQDLVIEPPKDGLQRVILAFENADAAEKGAKALLKVPLRSPLSGSVLQMRVTSLHYQKARYNKLGYITEEIGACRRRSCLS